MSKFPTAGYHIITILSRPSTVRISRKLAVESRRVRAFNWPPKPQSVRKSRVLHRSWKGRNGSRELRPEGSGRSRLRGVERAPFKRRRMRHPTDRGLKVVPPANFLKKVVLGGPCSLHSCHKTVDGRSEGHTFREISTICAEG